MIHRNTKHMDMGCFSGSMNNKLRGFHSSLMASSHFLIGSFTGHSYNKMECSAPNWHFCGCLGVCPVACFLCANAFTDGCFTCRFLSMLFGTCWEKPFIIISITRACRLSAKLAFCKLIHEMFVLYFFSLLLCYFCLFMHTSKTVASSWCDPETLSVTFLCCWLLLYHDCMCSLHITNVYRST